MIARTLKNNIRAKMRQLKSSEEQKYRELVVNAFNLVRIWIHHNRILVSEAMLTHYLDILSGREIAHILEHRTEGQRAETLQESPFQVTSLPCNPFSMFFLLLCSEEASLMYDLRKSVIVSVSSGKLQRIIL
jgi:hypothetical protein